MNENQAAVVEAVMRRRKTEKVLCHDIDSRQSVPIALAEKYNPLVRDAIKAAGWAPFHYPRSADGIVEPWRAHVLWDEKLQAAAQFMRDSLPDAKSEAALIAGCHALVLVTWLPGYYRVDEQGLPAQPASRQKEINIDEEHLAAASAMVQNLLLMLTAHEMGNYWSSGGKLRERTMFDYFGIPNNERLLAAVFIEYPELPDACKQRKPGKLRDSRSLDWIREIEALPATLP
ncbi:nitroreductase [Methylophaga frappieri]|uniref:Nitroreductase n=1 Tax=Methylophaga frappieri (strain ATCC BAA-2434 / DSM 25690 / JAM7) TaxID=754477 RepID=I1YH44_METFJ|nr:nitroreductase family protein [Methylophaga frappieri]AFJ02237.1 nitroreductase [Methylophaga frappieri]